MKIFLPVYIKENFEARPPYILHEIHDQAHAPRPRLIAATTYEEMAHWIVNRLNEYQGRGPVVDTDDFPDPFYEAEPIVWDNDI